LKYLFLFYRLSINITDRILFILITKIYSQFGTFHEIPIYFSRTNLEDNSTGINAYKLFSINLTENMKIIILSDSSLNLKKIKERYFKKNQNKKLKIF
jgi:hypothetical protein